MDLIKREPLITNKDATETHIRRTLKRKGFSEDRIVKYLRGWNLVKEGTNLKPRVKKESNNDKKSKRKRKPAKRK